MTNSSLTDAVFEVETATTSEELNKMLTSASEGSLKGILRVRTSSNTFSTHAWKHARGRSHLKGSNEVKDELAGLHRIRALIRLC